MLLSVYVINYDTVNVMNEEDVIKGIENYSKVTVKSIIMTKYDEDQYFVLYEDDLDQVRLCIFDESRLSFGRYYRPIGGSSGNLPGSFIFSEGTKNGYKQLSVAYGKTAALSSGNFKVIFESETLIVTPTKTYFMEIFREETQHSGMIYFEFD